MWLVGRYRFREHNKEADPWAEKGVKGYEEEWTDTANVVWSKLLACAGLGMAAASDACVVLDIGSGLHADFGMGYNSQKMRTSTRPKFP